MRRTRRPARRPACTLTEGRSPLQGLEESFLTLATGTAPLTLPAHLVCEEPEQPVLPVDQIRTRLAHPATAPGLREQTWREVVRRAQQFGAPWDTVAVAMTVPVLRRILAQMARPAHLERADVEQEALAAVAAAVRTVDVNATDVGRELFASAHRSALRLVRAARRHAVWESESMAVHLGRLDRDAARTRCHDHPAGAAGAEGDEGPDEVLARAVKAGAVSVAEARLIARTRLDGEPMDAVAVERGVSVRQLYRHRAAAEQHLAAYLKARLGDQ